MSRNAVGRPRRSRIMRLSTVPSGRSTLVTALAVAVLAALAPVGNAAGGGGRTGGVGGHGGELGGVRGGSDVVRVHGGLSGGAGQLTRGRRDASPARDSTAASGRTEAGEVRGGRSATGRSAFTPGAGSRTSRAADRRAAIRRRRELLRQLAALRFRETRRCSRSVEERRAGSAGCRGIVWPRRR